MKKGFKVIFFPIIISSNLGKKVHYVETAIEPLSDVLSKLGEWNMLYLLPLLCIHSIILLPQIIGNCFAETQGNAGNSWVYDITKFKKNNKKMRFSQCI